jgi:hypothetical protein
MVQHFVDDTTNAIQYFLMRSLSSEAVESKNQIKANTYKENGTETGTALSLPA